MTAAHRPALLIHVGFHKTGTTYLQTGLFQEAAQGFSRPWSSQQIRSALVFPTDFTFDPVAARRSLEEGFDSADDRDLVAVLSDERLSGSPHAGGFDSARIAERLRAVFPEARVLIGIREQRSAIYSVYQQYVRNGGAAPLEKYLRPRNPAEVPQFSLEHFEYHHLVLRYQELFGRENVLVLPWEWLAQRPEEFLGRIAALVGRDITAGATKGMRYASMGALTIAAKRRANFWLVRNSLNPAAPLYVKRHEERFERLDRLVPRAWHRFLETRYRQRIEEVVDGRYSASNRVTAQLSGLPLAELGYPMADDDLT